MLAILLNIGLLSVASTAPISRLSVCDATQGRTDGAIVEVTGVVITSIHGMWLFDHKCPKAMLVLGSDTTDRDTGPNASFYDAAWQNHLPRGRVVRATLRGKLWYRPARERVGTLEHFVAVRVTLGSRKKHNH